MLPKIEINDYFQKAPQAKQRLKVDNWYNVIPVLLLLCVCILLADLECVVTFVVVAQSAYCPLFAILETLSCWLFITKVPLFFMLIHLMSWLFRKWGFEKLVFRNSITGVRRDRKYAIKARNAYSTGVHMSQNVIGRTTHKTESLIRYYHYHNSINVMGEPCREFVPKPTNGSKVMFEGIPYVYDDNMKRMAGEIKHFEEETLGTIRT